MKKTCIVWQRGKVDKKLHNNIEQYFFLLIISSSLDFRSFKGPFVVVAVAAPVAAVAVVVGVAAVITVAVVD